MLKDNIFKTHIAEHVLAYLIRISGNLLSAKFSPKDFNTWNEI